MEGVKQEKRRGLQRNKSQSQLFKTRSCRGDYVQGDGGMQIWGRNHENGKK